MHASTAGKGDALSSFFSGVGLFLEQQGVLVVFLWPAAAATIGSLRSWFEFLLLRLYCVHFWYGAK